MFFKAGNMINGMSFFNEVGERLLVQQQTIFLHCTNHVHMLQGMQHDQWHELPEQGVCAAAHATANYIPALYQSRAHASRQAT
jgi:hypothetical protein